jgi:hypothetical protein
MSVPPVPGIPDRLRRSSATFRPCPYRTVAVPAHPNGEPDVMAVAAALLPGERIVSVYPTRAAPGAHVELQALLERVVVDR